MKLITPVATIVLMLAGSAVASEPTFQCSELKKLVDAAGSHFDGLGASVREREAAADLATRYGVSIEELGVDRGYKQVTLGVEQPLSGAIDCEIADATMVNESVDQRQTAFNCRYEGYASIPDAMSEELESCLQMPVDPESDDQSLTIWVDRVESGEGYSWTALEVAANAAGGLTIGVVKTVCLNRSYGGCENEN